MTSIGAAVEETGLGLAVDARAAGSDGEPAAAAGSRLASGPPSLIVALRRSMSATVLATEVIGGEEGEAAAAAAADEDPAPAAAAAGVALGDLPPTGVSTNLPNTYSSPLLLLYAILWQLLGPGPPCFLVSSLINLQRASLM